MAGDAMKTPGKLKGTRVHRGATTEEDRDQEQFFKDLSATVEQTVEEVRGAEENFFSVLQKTTSSFPWIVDLNKKLQSYAEQHFTAALEFGHKLSQAKDFEDLGRIQIEFIKMEMQSFGDQATDFAKTYTSAASAMKAPLGVSF